MGVGTEQSSSRLALGTEIALDERAQESITTSRTAIAFRSLTISYRDFHKAPVTAMFPGMAKPLSALIAHQTP
jgi:hypothetical protein